MGFTASDGSELTAIAQNNTAIAAGVATDTVIKANPGHLARALVTAVGTANLLIYDNVSAGSGVVIGIVKSTAVVGDYVDIQMPANNGITVKGAATNAGVTIAWT